MKADSSSRRQYWLHIGGNFLLFQLLWPAAIFGAVAGSSHWSLAVLALMVLHGVLFGPSQRADAIMLFSGLLIGLLFESALLAAGLIEYRLQFSAALPPMWILALWLGFAQTFNHSLGWLRRRLSLAALLGGSASVVSLFWGIHFGAADTTQPWLLGVAYAVGWALMVPLLAWLSRSLERRGEQQGVWLQ